MYTKTWKQYSFLQSLYLKYLVKIHVNHDLGAWYDFSSWRNSLICFNDHRQVYSDSYNGSGETLFLPIKY